MSFTQGVINQVKNIPRGRVMTYGQIAALCGNPRLARFVSGVLRRYEEEDLPWHRVINGKGMISLPLHEGYALQKRLLEDEGVVFDHKDRICLKQFAWQGRFESCLDEELPL